MKYLKTKQHKDTISGNTRDIIRVCVSLSRAIKEGKYEKAPADNSSQRGYPPGQRYYSPERTFTLFLK